ncbi:aminotransferase class V-fold PLP-dependent enzyme [Jejudonia soesokkakensis]|uniref:Aminotransferase class V-fold PLP-dependent enzyme n=1 Tax=Jejudonia soesokkakensis TaxID=1323432 RepID=A0ABW2MSI9_9FLAO
MEDLRKQFPVLSKYTYLNTASSGLLSNDLIQWRREEDKKLHENGSVHRDTHKIQIESIRSSIARFFTAKNNEVALVPNFSFGLNTLIEGFSRGQKVLLLKNDYPSINWVFEHRDFDVCYAAINENLEENIEAAIARHKPDILAFSLVQYLTGIKINFDFIKQLKAYHPNLMIIADGTQYLGTESFSFSESGIDILGCSAYKWMLSGYGNGFMMIKEAAQQPIFPSTIGFNSADGIYSKQNDIPFVKRLEPGHQDVLTYGSIEQSIQLMERVGIEDISEKNKQLTDFAAAQFSEKGLLKDSVLKRKEHSTIFSIKGDEVVFQKLKKNNIICSQRGDGIRISFHFYNTKEEIQKVLDFV